MITSSVNINRLNLFQALKTWQLSQIKLLHFLPPACFFMIVRLHRNHIFWCEHANVFLIRMLFFSQETASHKQEIHE